MSQVPPKDRKNFHGRVLAWWRQQLREGNPLSREELLNSTSSDLLEECLTFTSQIAYADVKDPYEYARTRLEADVLPELLKDVDFEEQGNGRERKIWCLTPEPNPARSDPSAPVEDSKKTDRSRISMTTESNKVPIDDLVVRAEQYVLSVLGDGQWRRAAKLRQHMPTKLVDAWVKHKANPQSQHARGLARFELVYAVLDKQENCLEQRGIGAEVEVRLVPTLPATDMLEDEEREVGGCGRGRKIRCVMPQVSTQTISESPPSLPKDSNIQVKQLVGKDAEPEGPDTEGLLNGQVISAFNYGLLEAKLADKVRSAADRIRDRMKKTVIGIIEIGRDLLAVKKAIPHGQFLPWLKVEFDWSERAARNFMAVAEQFGKSAKIADMPIRPAAAYLLAAPSTPDQARAKAVERAESGEEITIAKAKEIVAECKTKRTPGPVPHDKLADRLEKILGRYFDRWPVERLPQLAMRLRGFADAIEGQKGGKT